MRRIARLGILGATLLSGAAVAAPPPESCQGFKWDVSREHALFMTEAAKLSAGTDVASAPALRTERLYEFDLTQQSEVVFALPPGKHAPAGDAFAGIAKFSVVADGTYRVSVDVPLWIDVVGAGVLLAAKDFGGQPGCVPHKIVEYDLRAAQPLILQMSAAATRVVHLTITRTDERP